jgi:hypothetical protein
MMSREVSSFRNAFRNARLFGFSAICGSAIPCFFTHALQDILSNNGKVGAFERGSCNCHSTKGGFSVSINARENAVGNKNDQGDGYEGKPNERKTLSSERGLPGGHL